MFAIALLTKKKKIIREHMSMKLFLLFIHKTAHNGILPIFLYLFNFFLENICEIIKLFIEEMHAGQNKNGMRHMRTCTQKKVFNSYFIII